MTCPCVPCRTETETGCSPSASEQFVSRETSGGTKSKSWLFTKPSVSALCLPCFCRKQLLQCRIQPGLKRPVRASGAENTAACLVEEHSSTRQRHVTPCGNNVSVSGSLTFTLVPGEDLPSCFDHCFQNLKSIVLEHVETERH